MAYTAANLTPHDTTDLDWALAWVRFVMRDTSALEQYTDAEYTAVLGAHAFVENAVTYYRPHVAAAALVASDPERAISEALLGANLTHRDPSAIALAIRSQCRWIDALIEEASGVRPPSGRTLTAVF